MDAPALQALTTADSPTRLEHGGILYIDAQPADTSFRLEHGHRALVEVAVSSGDHETARLYRLLCPARNRGPGYACFEFTLLMQQGATASSVADRVTALGGRFNSISPSGRVAGVTVFDPDDLVEKARAARRWPGVQVVELVGFACAGGVPCFSRADLHAPLPVDSGTAAPEDGIVQVRGGDTVTVSYRQPDGSTLLERRPVP